MIQLDAFADIVRSNEDPRRVAETLLRDRFEIEENAAVDLFKRLLSDEGGKGVKLKAETKPRGLASALVDSGAMKDEEATGKDAKDQVDKLKGQRNLAMGGAGVAALAMAAAIGIPKIKRMLAKKHEDKLLRKAGLHPEQQAAAAASQPAPGPAAPAAPPAAAPPDQPVPGDTPVAVQPVPTVVAQERKPDILVVHHRQPMPTPPPPPPNPAPAPYVLRVGPPISKRPEAPMPMSAGPYVHPVYGQVPRTYTAPSISQMPRVPMGRGIPYQNMPQAARPMQAPRMWG